MDNVQEIVSVGIKRSTFAVLVLALGLMSSCATVKGWRGGSADEPTVVQAENALETTATPAEMEAELLRLVKRHIEENEADSSNNQGRVIRKKPYYFKEYSNYPGTVKDAKVELTETESRTSPFVADVKLDKVRHATRLHRRREEARADDGFLRDTGVETLSYELRNGRWTRVGSFFLAETTEEKVNGDWVVVQRVIERTVVAEEPQPGWFGKAWSRVSGKK